MIVIEVFLLSLVASFIQRTTGFGFGIFIMTLLPFVMPSYPEATTLSGLLAMTTSLYVTFLFRKYITWKRLLPILTVFIIVSITSVFMLGKIESVTMHIVLGSTLIVSSIYFIFFSKRIKIRPSIGAQVTLGALSGLMGGFFSMQGPPAVIYFLASEEDKNHYMGMVQCYFLLGNMALTVTRTVNGFVTADVLRCYLYGLGGLLLGNWIGTKVFNLIPNKLFRTIVYSYIGISGLIVIVTTLI